MSKHTCLEMIPLFKNKAVVALFNLNDSRKERLKVDTLLDAQKGKKVSENKNAN